MPRSSSERPSSLQLWTADECAECLTVSPSLRAKLWEIVAEARNPTPLGGDGSGNTVETPDGRLSSENDDKIENFWSRLTEAEQEELRQAAP